MNTMLYQLDDYKLYRRYSDINTMVEQVYSIHDKITPDTTMAELKQMFNEILLRFDLKK